jgi:glutamate-1-semialdehyde 2,1-aminomutase
LCGSQPFFSVDDWFIGVTPMNAGVPVAIQQLTHLFPYGDVTALRQLFDAHPGQFAAVMLEPATWQEPPPRYLAEMADLCRGHGAILIFDETITGFRWHLGGAQAVYGVTPDLTVLGKAMGNGFAIAALLGKRELMRLGGLDHDQPRVFLLSYTHGAEPVGLAAAEAVARIYEAEGIVERLYTQGRRLADGVAQAATTTGVSAHVKLLGRPCNLVYQTRDREDRPSQGFRTLFLQELLRRGILAPSLVISAAHDDATVDEAVDAISGALAVYRRALDDGLEHYLESRPVQPVMRALNRAPGAQ